MNWFHREGKKRNRLQYCQNRLHDVVELIGINNLNSC